MKTITFAVPCYNSAEYMDKCIESLLACDDGRNDIQIVIVDDGSTKDDTPASRTPRAATSRWSTPTTGWIPTPCAT